MKHTDLESLVNLTLLLEYEERMSIPRIAEMLLATVALVTGIVCFTLFDSAQLRYQLLGSVSFALFIRLIMGTPIERRLTTESKQRLQQWMREHESAQNEE